LQSFKQFLCSLLSSFAVYLYGAAATSDDRKTVPQIRAGEYEGLQEKVGCFEVYRT